MPIPLSLCPGAILKPVSELCQAQTHLSSQHRPGNSLSPSRFDGLQVPGGQHPGCFVVGHHLGVDHKLCKEPEQGERGILLKQIIPYLPQELFCSCGSTEAMSGSYFWLTKSLSKKWAGPLLE